MQGPAVIVVIVPSLRDPGFNKIRTAECKCGTDKDKAVYALGTVQGQERGARVKARLQAGNAIFGSGAL